MVSVAPESRANSSSRTEPSWPSASDARAEPNGFAALVDAKTHPKARARAAESGHSAAADRQDSTQAPRRASSPTPDSRESVADANAEPSNQTRRSERAASDDRFSREADVPSKRATAAQDPDNAGTDRPERTSATDTATDSATPTPPGIAVPAIVEAVAGAVNAVDATNFTIAKTIATTPVPVSELSVNAEAPPASASQLASVLGATAIKGAKASDTPPATPADPAASDGALRPHAASDAAKVQPHPAGTAGADATPQSPPPDGDRANGDSARPPAGGQHPAATASQAQSMSPDAMSSLGAPLATQQTPTVATVPAAQPQSAATAATNLAIPVGGLAVEIAASARAGNSRFEIRLDPAELGRIDVRLDVDRHGQITSHLTVEKPETLAMLRQDAPQLQRALEDAGLKTGQDSLQFSLRDQSSGNQNHGDAERRPHRLVIGDAGVTSIAATANTTYIHAAGASRSLDIRV
ncbi:MAG: flagellar hook-length control protein FliK [Xanthobacteraceae bacterium]|nr:flagellar hook-length control protein FliK [Xanthobacteraceae bacterium]